MDFSTFCLWFAFGNVISMWYISFTGKFISPIVAFIPVLAFALHFISKP